MVRTTIKSLLFCVFSFQVSSSAGPVISQGLDGSRVGDQLISYMHAKWISYKTGFPLFYKPFPYSDQLVLHYKEKRLDQVSSHYSTLSLQPGQNVDAFLKQAAASDVICHIPYFPESLEE